MHINFIAYFQKLVNVHTVNMYDVYKLYNKTANVITKSTSTMHTNLKFVTSLNIAILKLKYFQRLNFIFEQVFFTVYS